MALATVPPQSFELRPIALPWPCQPMTWFGRQGVGCNGHDAALSRYGSRSVEGLERGANEVRDMVHALLAQVPPPIDRAAGIAAEYMPGHNLRKGYRQSVEAADLRSQGRYLDSLDKSADAMDSGANFLFWLTPGGGLVPKIR